MKEQKKEWVKQTFGTDFYRALLTPKYVNGIASLIYDKSKTFYGYSDVKKKINRFKYIITVEGYLDFVTAYQAGIYNVIALGSASFTDD